MTAQPAPDLEPDSEWEHAHQALDHSAPQLDQDRGPALRELLLRPAHLPRLPLLAMIRLYQVTISRALPAGTCRFYPTCSHYGYQAIAKYGLIKGTGLAVRRVLRCQPFNPGGYDPVP